MEYLLVAILLMQIIIIYLLFASIEHIVDVKEAFLHIMEKVKTFVEKDS